jgi:hypothetical protein
MLTWSMTLWPRFVGSDCAKNSESQALAKGLSWFARPTTRRVGRR